MNRQGQHLRELRERLGFSLRYTARKAKITAPYLSDIELGRRHPSDRVLSELAKVLRIGIEELRLNDVPALLAEIQRRIAVDPDLVSVLRRLLNECPTLEELKKAVGQSTHSCSTR